MPPPWTSQNIIDDFWLHHLTPDTSSAKALSVLPKDFHKAKISNLPRRGNIPSTSVSTSYNAAVAACAKKVAHIVRECRALNLKYTDPYFDLDDKEYCMYPLSMPERKDGPEIRPNRGLNLYDEAGGGERKGHLLLFGNGDMRPQKPPPPPSVKRVGDIFDNPQFFVDGASAKDVRQGGGGDCWFMSALMGMCNTVGTGSLLEKVCVARDQDVGVYGFVVFRDGEWESVIIDDKLFLRKPDYDDLPERRRKEWESIKVRDNSAEDWRMEFQRNSNALWFAQSTHEDETWVPLLEKAYAKAHGDYGAIHGGNVGEAMEDLTGGISSVLGTRDILSKDRLWEDLLKVNTEYLFGCASPNWDDENDDGGNDGIQANHAYSILRAVEYKNERLLLVKNPWGRTEWKGPWSDGAKEWTHESIRDLGHVFGDDGIFWIRYQDLLRKYDEIYRTRLFSDEWRVAQQWVNIDVPWVDDYLNTKFEVTLDKGAQTAFVLSQLDDRYFRGLIGQYVFLMSFRVHKKGEEDYIVRTHGGYFRQRSVGVELFLEAGIYEVRMKVEALKNEKAHLVEDIVKANWLERREKLLQVGLSYDIAHAKGLLEDDEDEDEVKPEQKKEGGQDNAKEDRERKGEKQESGKKEGEKVEGKQETDKKDGEKVEGMQETDKKEGEKVEGKQENEEEGAANMNKEPHNPAANFATSQDKDGEDDEWEDEEETEGFQGRHARVNPPLSPREYSDVPRNFFPGRPRDYSPGPRRNFPPGPRNYPPGRPRKNRPGPPRNHPPGPPHPGPRRFSPPPLQNYVPRGPRYYPDDPPRPIFQRDIPRRGSGDYDTPIYLRRSNPGSPVLLPRRDAGRINDDASSYFDNAVNPKAWGAAAVVGLRVYCRDADAVVKIIQPGSKERTPAMLDVDDPAIDAVNAETGLRSGVETPRLGGRAVKEGM